ncbi:ABC transporter permease [Rhizohabitans arisaemae]|uniref:ABC transporter permease n=1 Tax=Rhizohabitans arisaemae TaxID=2720610 RepID=UPI0024B13DF3|nr:FtsX-like permease family protein [Rhizohabitans arisaemae]
MLKSTLAGLFAQKLRLLLTATAITLGVAFISGTFILTDTIQVGFNKSFADAADKIDVAVMPNEGEGDQPPSVPFATLAKVKAVPGVAEAHGLIQGTAALLGKDGRIAGRPTAGISVADGRLSRTSIVSGRLPGPGEAILDRNTAERVGYKPGDTIKVLGKARDPREFRLVGTFDVGLNQELASRGGVGLTHDEAMAVTGEKTYREINVLASEGVSPEQLSKAVGDALGTNFTVKTGRELGEAISKQNGVELGFVTSALLLFGLVALLVAGLVIYNTFSILLAQRVRETALLRCIGATRGQIFGATLLEAAVIGSIASVLGLGLGLGMGAGALSLLNLFDAGLPTDGVSLTARTILVGLAVGLGVTVLSALVPARAATRVAPIAALRTQSEERDYRASRTRMIFGSLLAVAGLAVTVAGVSVGEGVPALFTVVAGGVVFFFSVLVWGPITVRPLSRFVGWLPAKLFGVSGRLAVTNSHRNPKRSATTTVALTVGVTLMTLISMVTVSANATSSAEIDKNFPVEYLIGTQEGFEGTLPVALGTELSKHPEIKEVVRLREDDGKLTADKREGPIGMISAAAIGTTFKPEVKQGSLADFTPGTLMLRDEYAKDLGVKLGDKVPLATEKGSFSLKVSVIVGGQGGLIPSAMVPEADFPRYFDSDGDSMLMINSKDGVSPAKSRNIVDAAVKPYPIAQISSAAEIKSQINQALGRILWVIGGLLGLAIVISLIGIANTLTLSVVERTRESALLRALGLGKSQLRSMLSAEALILGIIGALIGVALGIGFGWAALLSLREEMIIQVPILQVCLFVLLAGIAAVLASVLPARRAAKASIVESLAAG